MRFVSLLVCILAVTSLSEASTRRVCASGCAYTNLQTAIDEAQPGDEILLRAGETYVGHFVLKAKDAGATAFITIRSDASDASLPAAGRRLVPEGKPGANTARAALARLVGRTGTYRAIPVIQAELGAHHYRLQFLDVDGISSEGYYTLVELGKNSTSQTLANAPHHIVLDRVYLHGHPQAGIQRGVALNGRSIDIVNSYIADIFSMDESQAIAGFNGAGPFLIENNYLEAATENIMFGGSDPRTVNLVPSDILIRGNHVTKRPAWRNAALATPGLPTASARTGGALAAGTHYFKVVARVMSGGNEVVSLPSAEVSVSVSASGAVHLSWAGVSGAAEYRVYRGTSAGGENRYLTASGTSLLYTGSSEGSGAPRTTASKWPIKNLLELKNAQRVTIDGNVFEHTWFAAQNGYALVFTPRNQEGTAPWSVVRDVTLINNIVRHASQGLSLLGSDNERSSQPMVNVRIANNVFDDISSAYGESGDFLVMTSGPSGVVVDHNTIVHNGKVVLVDTAPAGGFVFTNNFVKHNAYGIYGSGCGTGLSAMQCYFPGGVVTANVFAGGPQASYPAGNHFPSVATFSSSLTDLASGLFALVTGSPYRGAGTDGKDIGVAWGSVADEAAVIGGTTEGSGVPGDGDGGGGTGGGSVPAVLPLGWLGEDVGVVGVPGAASEASGTFTVSGAGADVWGTRDAFHFAYRELAGDGTIVARVASLAGSDAWLKAGVMIRASLDPAAAHGFMIVSKGKGLAFQRRASLGGLSLHEAGAPAPASAPMWVRLTRAGDVLTASTSTNGSTWTVVGSGTINLPVTVLVGLAVSSHLTTETATASFTGVAITEDAGLPAGWSSQDVGAVGRAGSADSAGGSVTVKGAGADIWGTADALHFAHRTLGGDGSITARVASIAGSAPWTKVGVMMRQTLDAGSAQATMLVSASKGLAFQRRPVTGGTSKHSSGGSGTAPRWVRLTRSGSVVTAAVSADGNSWQVVGSETMSLTGEIYVGLAVSSHDPTATATGVFEDVVVTP